MRSDKFHPDKGLHLRRMTVGLGTFVEVEVRHEEAGYPADARDPLVVAAEVLETVDARMHPTRAGSDLAAIAGADVGSPVAVHTWTVEVLSLAKSLWKASRGIFDPCLPERPGRLSDLELLSSDTVRRTGPPLRIDLGGIAKGFAIDRIVDALRDAGWASGRVNAGGDVRVFGPEDWPTQIRSGGVPRCSLTLRDEALAVSEPKSAASPAEHRGYYSRVGSKVVEGYPVAVCAPTAAVADALTKCAILRDPPDLQALLTEYGARSLEL